MLDGFREGWRKSYVELLDASVGGLLVAIAEAGGAAPLSWCGDGAWEAVAAGYGYVDDSDRGHVIRLVRAMVAQLADIGAVDLDGDQVVLTALGSLLAVMASDDDSDDLDLVDTDAQSLLLVCVEDMEAAEATEALRAWCSARAADEAADELGEAMLDDDDPDLWLLGLEALTMLDPQAATPVVKWLQAHPGLEPLATAWLRRPDARPERRGRR